MAVAAPSTCQECSPVNPKLTHTVREHDIAVAWIPAFMDYIKVDAFSRTDRPLSYREAIDKFDLGVTVHRAGRVLDAVEAILLAQGWPRTACAGVAAYLVNASTREPAEAWMEIWKARPRDARGAARDHVRELALAD